MNGQEMKDRIDDLQDQAAEAIKRLEDLGGPEKFVQAVDLVGEIKLAYQQMLDCERRASKQKPFFVSLEPDADDGVFIAMETLNKKKVSANYNSIYWIGVRNILSAKRMLIDILLFDGLE